MKILVILNGIQFPNHVASFATSLAKKTSSLVEGIFLNRLDYKTNFFYPFPNDLNQTAVSFTSESIEGQNLNIIESHIQVFRDACEKEGIRHKISSFTETSLDEVIDHSAFADLIIADAKADPDQFSLKELLSDAHCPLCLVSRNVTLPQKVILTYDGSYSSIYAIKMFSYLFPEWRNLPTYLVSVTPSDNSDTELEYEYYLHDWLAQHFPQISINILHGKPGEEIVSFIQDYTENAIVTMGAYGRNAVSRLFHQSLAHVVMERTNASLFITHE